MGSSSCASMQALGWHSRLYANVEQLAMHRLSITAGLDLIYSLACGKGTCIGEYNTGVALLRGYYRALDYAPNLFLVTLCLHGAFS